MTEQKALEAVALQVCIDVAELPDRSSPDDWPDAMLVTSSELRDIVLTNIAALQPPSGGLVAMREALQAAEELYQTGILFATDGQIARVNELRRKALTSTPPMDETQGPSHV